MRQKLITIWNTFHFFKKEEEFKDFFQDLLTEKETKELSNRWKVAQLLFKNTSYKDIEKEVGMSSTTIAKISKLVQKNNSGYKNLLLKLKI